MRKIAARLSYANVMSTLAVFLLLGGAGAYAAKKQKIGSTQLKASAVTTSKIKNGAVGGSKLAAAAVGVDKLADGAVTNAKLADGAVSTAKLGSDAVTGDKVNEATLGEVPSANSANPLAFAKVNAAGIVDGANSKGITSLNVSHPATGVYCVNVPSFVPRGGQVTTQGGGVPAIAQVAIGGGASCPPSAVQVLGWSMGAAPAPADTGFLVALYR